MHHVLRVQTRPVVAGDVFRAGSGWEAYLARHVARFVRERGADEAE